MKKIVLVLTFSLLSLLFANTIHSKTNIQKLDQISRTFKNISAENKAESIKLAQENGWIIKKSLSNGSLIEIQYVDEFGKPQYYTTSNIDAAESISTNEVHGGGSSGLNLSGSGIHLHQWDAGSARTTHQEYGGRVTISDGASNHYHSGHVAGTMVAAGVDADAKGMAYEATLECYDWNSDTSEMASEAASGAIVSNHSYGYVRGWYYDNGWIWNGGSAEEDYLFGFYDNNVQEYDEIAYNAPGYLICKSARNDRGDGPGDNDAHPNDGPYDCIGQIGIAKNILTVGAVRDVTDGYSNPSSVLMTDFSSWGPADDGRIKPDICANGYALYSSYASSNSAYGTLNGTSMATPSAAGSLALLQEYYQNIVGNFMLASSLKGVAIHTADECGTNNGPDYQFGWGLMNTKSAAELISNIDITSSILENSLNNGNSYSK